MADILAAEWLKLRTARSTWLVLGVLAVFTALMLAVAWYFVATWDGLTPERRANAALGSLPTLMGWIASLIMAVFGAVAITSECANGMIRTTFLAMPNRALVLLAKAVVVAVVTFVATEASLLVTLLGSAAILGDRPIGGQTPLDARWAGVRHRHGAVNRDVRPDRAGAWSDHPIGPGDRRCPRTGLVHRPADRRPRAGTVERRALVARARRPRGSAGRVPATKTRSSAPCWHLGRRRW